MDSSIYGSNEFEDSPGYDDEGKEQHPHISFDLSKDVFIELIWCPPGTFMMGSPSGELGRRNDETLHQVTLSKGFYLGKYLVTCAQYKPFGSILSMPLDMNIAHPTTPMYSVSWNRAMEFCDSLNSLFRNNELLLDYKFSLPTEAQWEYACRAGTTSALNNGRELTTSIGKCRNLDLVGWHSAWYVMLFRSRRYGLDRLPRRVGQKSPNAWGFYDMHGDLSEWCLDRYGPYSGTAVDPMGADKGWNSFFKGGHSRVMRGGSFEDCPRECRSASRNQWPASLTMGTLGFRLALVPKFQPDPN